MEAASKAMEAVTKAMKADNASKVDWVGRGAQADMSSI